MSVIMVRSTVKPECVDEAEVAVKEMFAAIAEAAPNGIRYAAGKVGDGNAFFALLEVEDGVDNPLPALPAFVAFQSKLGQWIAEPPTPAPLTVLGSYRLFDAV